MDEQFAEDKQAQAFLTEAEKLIAGEKQQKHFVLAKAQASERLKTGESL